MPTLTIRNLDEDTKQRLRERAARAGRSMEEEVRDILRTTVRGLNGPAFAALMEREFGGDQGVDLDLPSRQSTRGAVDFEIDPPVFAAVAEDPAVFDHDGADGDVRKDPADTSRS